MFIDAYDRRFPRLSYSEIESLMTKLSAAGETETSLYRKLYNARAAHLTVGNNIRRFPKRLAI